PLHFDFAAASLCASASARPQPARPTATRPHCESNPCRHGDALRTRTHCIASTGARPFPSPAGEPEPDADPVAPLVLVVRSVPRSSEALLTDEIALPTSGR